jgi:chromosomal replication initiator protein
VTIEMIQKLVADRYQLRITDLKARNNSSAVAFPRQVAMYLTKNLTRASLPEIGRCFGGKHHSTVIHSVKKIEAMRRSDPDFDRVINGLLGSFQ